VSKVEHAERHPADDEKEANLGAVRLAHLLHVVLVYRQVDSSEGAQADFVRLKLVVLLHHVLELALVQQLPLRLADRQPHVVIIQHPVVRPVRLAVGAVDAARQR